MRRPTYTPGPGGYALAVLASHLVFTLTCSVVAWVGAASAWHLARPADMLAFLVVGLMYGAIPAAVLGSLGALAVHGLCRHRPCQAEHVAAAGVAGVVAGLVLWVLLGAARELLGWVPVLGLSTAIGRAAVVPLVKARSHLQRVRSPGAADHPRADAGRPHA